ncbi:MAG: hypothetical protein II206_11065 [Bacteroidaceae bacterium]|nr:hypothetical protein [Bacteroidaceae bacterium]
MALSEKKKASNERWDRENLKRMSLAVPVDLHERMQAHIKQSGESMNGFIKRAIAAALEESEG